MIGSARRCTHVFVALALAAGAWAALGAAPASAADPVGYVIAQGEAECWLASVDLVTGATTQIGTPSPDKCAFDLEFTPDGTRLLGTRVDDADDSSIAVLIEFDLSTGDVTTLGQLGDFDVDGPGEDQGNLTLPSTGGLYTYLVPQATLDAVDPACDGSALCLFQGDISEANTLTYVNAAPQTFTEYFGLATSCAGVTSSVRNPELEQMTNGVQWPQAGGATVIPQTLTRVNLTSTGPGTTDVGLVGDGIFLSSLDYDTAGTLHAVGFEPENAGPSLFTVDPSTGAATQVTTLNDGSEPINVGVLGFAIAHPCTSVPVTPIEPPPAAQPLAVVTPRFTG